MTSSLEHVDAHGTSPWAEGLRIKSGHDETKRLSVLDLDRLRAVPLVRDPFDFIVVEEFVRRDALASLVADFPVIPGHGSFPSTASSVGRVSRGSLPR